MSIQVAPKNLNSSALPDIRNISSTKLRRTQRLQTDLNKLYTEAEVKARASYLKLPYVDLYGFPIDTTHLVTLPKAVAQRAKIGVFSIHNKEINLATPFLGYSGQKEIFDQLVSQGFNPKMYLCSELSFSRLLSRYDFVVQVKQVDDDINLSQDRIENISQDTNVLKDLESKTASISTSEAIELILMTAIQNKASDIHFEPEKDKYVLRLRLDGVLHNFANFPKEKQKAMENRLKIISGVKINIDNIPQDGRFTFNVGEKEIDVRVSMLPSNYGYSIVMRLLGTGNVALNLEALGFIGLAKERITRAITKPQGMIMTTGPTGSGKTTTLYTFLKELNDGERKIITLEDPIEYKLSGISQTQIDKEGGYTFASGLKSILRQDPDVVMIGEIRDKETADIAVQASLTGHQVLSTIHTNDAAGAIPRIMEMGIKGFLLADSLSAVIGQRLVRKVCPHCQKSYQPSAEETRIINEQLNTLPQEAKSLLPNQINFVTGTGCEKCNGLGYKGRIGVYEVMTVTDGLRNILSQENLSIMEVRQIAQKEGMVTMLQDAIIKATKGVTDIPEVFRNVAGNY